MTRFEGCGTALVTPFTDDGALDLRALRALVEWQIAEGIDFLVPCGSTGEAQTTDEHEREQVVSTVVSAANGRVPVMAGATSNDTRRAVEETRRMCSLGVDGILTATPYYNKPTQDGLLRHFRAVADASTVPVYLYNVPGRTAINLLPPRWSSPSIPTSKASRKPAATCARSWRSFATGLTALWCSPATTGWRSPSWPRADMG